MGGYRCYRIVTDNTTLGVEFACVLFDNISEKVTMFVLDGNKIMVVVPNFMAVSG